jgi:phage-related minor tail protein
VAAGEPYIVGEKGPELFQPGQSGVIVPNHALRSSGGAVGGVTNIYYVNASSLTERQIGATVVGALVQHNRERGPLPIKVA